jgi:hypothetical protein
VPPLDRDQVPYPTSQEKKEETTMKIRHSAIGDVFAVLREMKADGIVKDYAIGGAVAAMFYMEPIDTHDLDIFVIFPGSSLLVSLTPAYAWLHERGFKPDGEHVRVMGVPVQLLAAAPGLGEEAIAWHEQPWESLAKAAP